MVSAFPPKLSRGVVRETPSIDKLLDRLSLLRREDRNVLVTENGSGSTQVRGSSVGMVTNFTVVVVKNRETLSYPPAVGAPRLDALLDLLAVQILFEGLIGEIQHFPVRCKAQADQLVFRQAVDPSAPFRRGERLQA